jgi:hypothetical protein
MRSTLMGEWDVVLQSGFCLGRENRRDLWEDSLTNPSPSRPLKKSANWRALITSAHTERDDGDANVGLDSPPAAVELAVRRCAHADAANSFGSRVRL